MTILFGMFIICTHAKCLKVLVFGNSFSGDAIEQNLYELAKANGDQIIIGHMCIGGCSLERHYINLTTDSAAYTYRKIINGKMVTKEKYTISKAFCDEEWNIITFQQVSEDSGIYDTYFPYITELNCYARENVGKRDVSIGFHITWAYAASSLNSGFAKYNGNQTKMYNAIINTAKRVLKETDVDFIIPTGTAIQNGRTSVIGDHFCCDGCHLELNYGRYTAACTWYEALFGTSVIGNSFIPENVTSFQGLIAQSAAHFAVITPFSVTSLERIIKTTTLNESERIIPSL